MTCTLRGMPIGPPPVCLNCRHLLPDGWPEEWRCPAYPERIPERIILGAPHDQVQPDQAGDIVFQPDAG